MIAEARRQFELAWSLTELHLAALVDDDFFWEPTNLCWTVRQDEAGVWRPDWADTEPDPAPVPDGRVADLAHRLLVDDDDRLSDRHFAPRSVRDQLARGWGSRGVAPSRPGHTMAEAVGGHDRAGSGGGLGVSVGGRRRAHDRRHRPMGDRRAHEKRRRTRTTPHAPRGGSLNTLRRSVIRASDPGPGPHP